MHRARGDDSHHRRHPSSGSLSSTESSWTDTGDIGEQHADDDPLRLQLDNDVEEQLLAGVRRHTKHPKKVRIHDPTPHRSRSDTIDKEAIQIPSAERRPPSRAERCLGTVMSGRNGSIHGLTGKALLYVPMPALSPAL